MKFFHIRKWQWFIFQSLVFSWFLSCHFASFSFYFIFSCQCISLFFSNLHLTFPFFFSFSHSLLFLLFIFPFLLSYAFYYPFPFFFLSFFLSFLFDFFFQVIFPVHVCIYLFLFSLSLALSLSLSLSLNYSTLFFYRYTHHSFYSSLSYFPFFSSFLNLFQRICTLTRPTFPLPILHSLLSFVTLLLFFLPRLWLRHLIYLSPYRSLWYVRYAPGATLCRCRDPHLRFTRVYNTKPTCLVGIVWCVTSRSVGASRRYGADIIGNRIQTLSFFTQRTKKWAGRRDGGQTVHVDTCVRTLN